MLHRNHGFKPFGILGPHLRKKNLPRVALQAKENFPVPRRLYKILAIVVKQKCFAIFGFLSNIKAFKELIVFLCLDETEH